MPLLTLPGSSWWRQRPKPDVPAYGNVRDMEDNIMSLVYIPKGGALVETCTRTVQGRMLLRPGPKANDLILGVLGHVAGFEHAATQG